MVNDSTSVFGYLFPAGECGWRVECYARFLSVDPSAMMVPLAARIECLESAVHNVRTGLVQGICVDPSLYSRMAGLVDAVTREASVAGVIDTVFADGKTGALVGDCSAVKAVTALTGNLDSVEDPVVLFYGNGWETRVAMTALSGRVTLMEIAGGKSGELDAIPTGCVVEYAGDDEVSPWNFDLVVNPHPSYFPPKGQSVLPLTLGHVIPFEAMRLAYSVGKFRGLPEKLCVEAAGQYEKLRKQV